MAWSIFSAEIDLNTDKCTLFWCSRTRRSTSALQSYQARGCQGTELLDQQRRRRGKLERLAIHVCGCSTCSEEKKKKWK